MKMKKIISLVLMVCMLTASFSATVLAAESPATNSGGDATDITVKGIYQQESIGADVISADITWGAMEFTYSKQGKWDPATHSYGDNTGNAGNWIPNGNEITVTNHSNVGITADFSFAKADNANVTGSFTNDSLQLSTAVGTAKEQAPSGSTEFNITSGSISENGDLGIISVSISKTSQEGQGTGIDIPEPDNTVKTASELFEAIGAGGTVTLGSDIDLGGDALIIPSDTGNVTIDLNGHTLTGRGSNVLKANGEGANLSIYNGTIEALNDSAETNAVLADGGTVSLNGCTVESQYGRSLRAVSGGQINVTDCTIGGQYITVDASSNVRFHGNIYMRPTGTDYFDCYGENSLTYYPGRYYGGSLQGYDELHPEYNVYQDPEDGAWVVEEKTQTP